MMSSREKFKLPFALSVKKKKIARFEGLPQFKWNNLGEQDVIGQRSFGAVFVTRYTFFSRKFNAVANSPNHTKRKQTSETGEKICRQRANVVVFPASRKFTFLRGTATRDYDMAQRRRRANVVDS